VRHLVFPLVVIPIVLASLVLAVRWLAGRVRSRVTWEDRCARCEYIVVGLAGDVCPECGADLCRPGAVRHAGVVPAKLTGDAIVVLWSVCFALAYWAVEATWLDRAPRVYVVDASRQLTGPTSGAYDGFEAQFQGDVYQGATIGGTVELTVQLRGNRSARLTVDPVTWAYRATDGPVAVRGEGEFDDQALGRWLAGYGVDASDPTVRRELQQVDAVLRKLYAGGYEGQPDFGGGQASSSARAKATKLVRGVRLAMALTWLIVAAWLWRRAHGSADLLRAVGVRV
jgi:hypothetical protein